MAIYCGIILGLQVCGFVGSLIQNKSQEAGMCVFGALVWLPVAGRVFGWW